MQALPDFKLISLSLETPPWTTKIVFCFIVFYLLQPIILISSSRFVLVFRYTVSLTLLIKSSNSFAVALPSLTKKLQCLSDIFAFPICKF